jgi:hypothetical protein
MLHNVALNDTLGAISGLGNIAPASLVKVFNLYKQGKFDEAKKAQEAVSIAGELEIKGGVPGMRVSNSFYPMIVIHVPLLIGVFPICTVRSREVLRLRRDLSKVSGSDSPYSGYERRHNPNSSLFFRPLPEASEEVSPCHLKSHRSLPYCGLLFLAQKGYSQMVRSSNEPGRLEGLSRVVGPKPECYAA